jgi:hypothetical protein
MLRLVCETMAVNLLLKEAILIISLNLETSNVLLIFCMDKKILF